MASALRDGTTAGAACLALMSDGKLPHIDIKVTEITAAGLEGLAPYQKEWKEHAHAIAR